MTEVRTRGGWLVWVGRWVNKSWSREDVEKKRLIGVGVKVDENWVKETKS